MRIKVVDDAVASVRASAPTTVPILVVVGLMYVLLRVTTMSSFTAIAAAGAAALVLLVTAAGLEGAAIALLTIGVALSPMDALRPVAAVEFVAASDVFLALGFGVLLPILIVRPARVNSAYVLAAGVLVLMCILSSVLSEFPLLSLNSTARLVVGALTLPFLFSLWQPPKNITILFASAFVLGNCFNLVSSFWRGIGDGGRRIGYSTHPNILGLAALLGLALIPFLLDAMPRWRLFTLLAGAGCAYAIWVSGSRAALLAAVAVALLYLVFTRSVPGALALFGLSIPALYIVADAYLSNENDSATALGRLLGGGSSQGSDQARVQLAEKAWDIFQAHPIIGSGLAEVMEAHNIYLQIAAAIGVVGAAVFLLVLGLVALRAFSLPKPFDLLILPVLGYAMIGVMTPILWDRYVWCVLALPFLVPWNSGDDDLDDHEEPVSTGSHRAGLLLPDVSRDLRPSRTWARAR